jgi:hypothetical protein
MLPLMLLLAPPPLSAGFAAVDVTPDVTAGPVYLAGFGHNRVATGVHDRLFARAVVLADGPDRVALVSVDVVGLFLPFVEGVRAKLPGFKYVLVGSTHNHEGPDTLGLWGKTPFTSGVDPAYLGRLEAGCVAAVQRAAATLTPVSARVGTAKGPELLHDARDPQVKHDDLVAVRFDAGGRPAGLVVQWNVHPELMNDRNTELTADHVGFTVAHLERKYGCAVVYLTGTVGGLLTNLKVPLARADGTPLTDGTFEKTAEYGKRVGELAERAVAAAVPATLTPFDIRTEQLLVPLANPLYKLGAAAGVLKREFYRYDRAGKRPFAAATDVTGPVAVKTEVGLLRLGELDVAAIPGEIYPELVVGGGPDPAPTGADFPDAPIEPAVYAQLRNRHRMLVGLANDEIGYILPKRQWDEKPPFTYGRKTAPYGEINSLGPDTAPVLLDAVRRLAAR